jgi:hypothetical protein
MKKITLVVNSIAANNNKFKGLISFFSNGNEKSWEYTSTDPMKKEGSLIYKTDGKSFNIKVPTKESDILNPEQKLVFVLSFELICFAIGHYQGRCAKSLCIGGDSITTAEDEDDLSIPSEIKSFPELIEEGHKLIFDND